MKKYISDTLPFVGGNCWTCLFNYVTCISAEIKFSTLWGGSKKLKFLHKFTQSYPNLFRSIVSYSWKCLSVMCFLTARNFIFEANWFSGTRFLHAVKVLLQAYMNNKNNAMGNTEPNSKIFSEVVLIHSFISTQSPAPTSLHLFSVIFFLYLLNEYWNNAESRE